MYRKPASNKKSRQRKPPVGDISKIIQKDKLAAARIVPGPRGSTPESPFWKAFKQQKPDGCNQQHKKDLADEVLKTLLPLAQKKGNRNYVNALSEYHRKLTKTQNLSRKDFDEISASVGKIEAKLTGKFQQEQEEKNAQLKAAIEELVGKIRPVLLEIKEKEGSATDFIERNDLGYFHDNIGVLGQAVENAKTIDEVAEFSRKFDRLRRQYEETLQGIFDSVNRRNLMEIIAKYPKEEPAAKKRGRPPKEKPDDSRNRRIEKIQREIKEFEASGFMEKSRDEVISVARELVADPSLDGKDKKWLAGFLGNDPNYALIMDLFAKRMIIWKLTLKSDGGHSALAATCKEMLRNGGRYHTTLDEHRWLAYYKDRIDSRNMRQGDWNDLEVLERKINEKNGNGAKGRKEGENGTQKLLKRCQDLRDRDLGPEDRKRLEKIISDIKMGPEGGNFAKLDNEVAEIEKRAQGSAQFTVGQINGKIKELISAINKANEVALTIDDDRAFRNARSAFEPLRLPDNVLEELSGKAASGDLVDAFLEIEASVKNRFRKYGVEYEPLQKVGLPEATTLGKIGNASRSMRPENALKWIDALKAAIEKLDVDVTSEQDDLTTGMVHGKLTDLAFDIQNGWGGLTTKKIIRRFLELEALALPILQKHGIEYAPFEQALKPSSQPVVLSYVELSGMIEAAGASLRKAYENCTNGTDDIEISELAKELRTLEASLSSQSDYSLLQAKYGDFLDIKTRSKPLLERWTR
jgi:hypothetical protein